MAISCKLHNDVVRELGDVIVSNTNSFAGIHIEDNKLSKDISITRLPTPDTVYISLSQHIGKHALPIVKVGDRVLQGQLIAQSVSSQDLSAKVYSSVSGTVAAINVKRPTTSGIANHIQITNDGLYEQALLPPLLDPTPQEIISRVQDSGIVGMGGAGFPTHIKLDVKTSIDTLIINGVECEPYITCDYRLLLEYTQQVLQGACCIAQAVSANNILIAIKHNPYLELNLKQVIEKDKRYCNCVVKALESIYPLGSEKQLIYSAIGRKVPTRKLPLHVGVVVSNVSTAYAVYNAVFNGMTSYERIVTVTGRGVSNQCNLIVANGVPIEYLLEYAKVDVDKVVKLVVGGPMMGTAVNNTQLTTTKLSNCILALTSQETNCDMPTECINCALCSKSCPMKLMPMYISKYGNADDAINSAKYGAKDCIECGCCNYVCPAKIPLVSDIRNAKKIIAKKERQSKITL